MPIIWNFEEKISENEFPTFLCVWRGRNQLQTLHMKFHLGFHRQCRPRRWCSRYNFHYGNDGNVFQQIQNPNHLFLNMAKITWEDIICQISGEVCKWSGKELLSSGRGYFIWEFHQEAIWWMWGFSWLSTLTNCNTIQILFN